ncbi:hypothetical protein [uncultured Wocania sp.]|uniref:hypothetical protein n=1 Tax=uncultured Wocania sp. TaxID=2834404 RepID=UPI0030FA4443
MNSTPHFTLFCLFLFQMQLEAQNPISFIDAQVNSSVHILPTCSYAGYHNGKVGLPNSFAQQTYYLIYSDDNGVIFSSLFPRIELTATKFIFL